MYNHSEVIITPAILTILYNKGFFSDMQHLSEVLFPIKNAILAVEVTNSTLTDTYVNLMKIAAVIQNLFTDDEYKGFCNHCIKKFNHRFKEFNNPTYQLAFFLHSAYKGAELKFSAFLLLQIMLENYGKKWLEGLAKIYQFNLLTAAEKFHKTQTEISSETMKNVAETVFNKFEEEAFLEESENAELSTEIQLNIFIQMNMT
ncbi:1705_t:CDS:2 [Rhizophagus irregularis]|nr:1705_t:CDS:2 [Rhizophagus irregularis]